jgi:hypothetical protein
VPPEEISAKFFANARIARHEIRRIRAVYRADKLAGPIIESNHWWVSAERE